MMNKFVFLLIFLSCFKGWSTVGFDETLREKLAHIGSIEWAKEQVFESRNKSGIVFLDNLDRMYPIADLNPLKELVKSLGKQYGTLILDCMPFTHKLSIYHHLPKLIAELNQDELKDSPVQVWLHPHLHIHNLDVQEEFKLHFVEQPMDLALELMDQANSIHPNTVSGVLTTATPLMIPEYLKMVSSFKDVLNEKHLKFGLLVDHHNVCRNLPKKLSELENFLNIFDELYFHLPSVLKSEFRTDDNLENSILEAKAFDVMFKTCVETLQMYLQNGKAIKPVRGFLHAKYDDDDKEENSNRVKFRLDIVRF